MRSTSLLEEAPNGTRRGWGSAAFPITKKFYIRVVLGFYFINAEKGRPEEGLELPGSHHSLVTALR